MDLREAILEEHSKKQVAAIVHWIGNDKQKIDRLMKLFLHDEYRVVQRAAWIVSDIAALHPQLMQRYIPALVNRLDDADTHIAVKRNVYRMMQYLDLPESIHSNLMNHCFESLVNPKEALAVRAFAMTILARFAAIYPEIRNELKLIIDDALLQETAPSFKSRAKKTLKQIADTKSS